MFTLLVRAVTLEGAGEGLLLYVTPDWSKLYTSECWIDSATQIFFAYSIGKKNLDFSFFCFTVIAVYSTCTTPDVLNI
jgi:SNF family Na+-dependent transporter